MLLRPLPPGPALTRALGTIKPLVVVVVLTIVGLEGPNARKSPIEAVALLVSKDIPVDNLPIEPKRGFASQNCSRLVEIQNGLERSNLRHSLTIGCDHRCQRDGAADLIA